MNKQSFSTISATFKGFFKRQYKISKFENIIFWLVLFLFALVSYSTMGMSGRYPLNYVAMAVYGLCAFFCLLYVVVFGSIRIGTFVFLLAFFNFCVLVSFCVNGFINFTATPILLSTASFLFYEFLCQTKEGKEKALFFITMGTWVFLLQFFIIYFKDVFHPSVSASNRIGVFFGNQNDVGRFLAFSVLFNFYYAFFKKRYLLYLPAAISFYFMVLTGSISNILICSVAVFGSLLYFLKGKTRTTLAITAIFLVITGFFWSWNCRPSIILGFAFLE